MTGEPSVEPDDRAPGGPRPDPAMVFGVALLVSLALWLPVARSTLAGHVELTTSALRYLVGFALSWAGISAVATVWVRYETAPRTRPARVATMPPPGVPARRRVDAEPPPVDEPVTP
jgi:hypothetical protein